MKKYLILIGVLLVCFITMAFIEYTREEVKPITVTTTPIITSKTKVEPKPIFIKVRDHNAFLHALGNFESGNRYDKVNRFGYMGRYQFGKATLKAVDINVSRKIFINSPDLQEEAMQRLMLDNYKNLRRFIRKYEGKYRHGVLVTKSGVLAAAHLGGSGNVRRWFRNGKNFADGNGTKITTYMKIFKGYELDI